MMTSPQVINVSFVAIVRMHTVIFLGYMLVSSYGFSFLAIQRRSYGDRVSLLYSSSEDHPRVVANKKGFGFSSASIRASSSHNKRSISGNAVGSGTKALRDAANTYDHLHSLYGKACVTDLYVRSPLNDPSIYWFVGKVARRLDDNHRVGSTNPTELDAVLSQKRIILEWAKIHLRPQNFGGSYSKQLEIWMAPGDSEMDVVQNKVVLVQARGSASKDMSQGFHVSDVGFNPEIYVGEEVTQGGLRVKRNELGQPLKPAFDINESSS